MKLLFSILVGAGILGVQVAGQEPKPVPDLVGIYEMTNKATGKSGGYFSISAQRGRFFLVGHAFAKRKPELDWDAHGRIEGDGGWYDWAFPDGKAGRTTFTIAADGSLDGHVKGGGLDWKYSAKRVSRSPSGTQLVGTYALYKKEESGKAPISLMTIFAQHGSQFLVGNTLATGGAAEDWEGRGQIDGDTGAYDWVFLDGKKGRTTFTVDADGNLCGEVRGAGIDWNYVGKRYEGPVRSVRK